MQVGTEYQTERPSDSAERQHTQNLTAGPSEGLLSKPITGRKLQEMEMNEPVEMGEAEMDKFGKINYDELNKIRSQEACVLKEQQLSVDGEPKRVSGGGDHKHEEAEGLNGDDHQKNEKEPSQSP